MKSRLTVTLALGALLVLNSALAASACPFCGGGGGGGANGSGDLSGNKMVQAADWGIFAMVIIMFAMLGALIGFGFYLNYRAKHPLPDYEELLDENETRPEPGSSL